MPKDYSAPPILEAIVEFRFAEHVSFETVRSSRSDKFRKQYANETTDLEINTEISPEGVRAEQKLVGQRFTSSDELRIAVVKIDSLMVAQLAPYVGWDEFRSRIIRDLDFYFDAFGRKKINRVGIRFINRLDIAEETVTITDYLLPHVTLPDLGNTTGVGYAFEATRKLNDIPYAVTFRSGTTPAPVPRTVSFLFDIDVFREGDIPLRDDEIHLMLDEMRGLKNRVFELSITDKARELFR